MFIKLYAVSITAFLALDFLWLGFIAKGLYARQIGQLLKPDVNWVAAILFYLIFVAGLVVFVIQPSLRESWTNAALMGAFFGLVAYATFDLTSLALLRDWPVLVTVIDLAWGATLGAAVSVITHVVVSRW